ncbi:MAG: carboxymuconolactone decarboxylase family protein [Myxococcota bacterium]|jgi:AhpD family alkylhydroperoxidase|nr:carboxymuconolactone decarboxylase family protein [Myxococcota bacterium]
MSKRHLRVQNGVLELSRYLQHAPTALGVLLSGRVPAALRERTLLAVSVANRCRYCAFVHALWARLTGVEAPQIEALLRSTADDEVALGVARQFVAEGGALSDEARRSLVEAYGDKLARDIEALLHLIDLANLSGNTFDAFLARLRAPQPFDAQAALETLFFQSTAAVYLPLLGIIALARRNVSWLKDLPS